MTILGTRGGDVAEGTARYGREQYPCCCQRCGERASIWDIDGSWCTDDCQRSDRRTSRREVGW